MLVISECRRKYIEKNTNTGKTIIFSERIDGQHHEYEAIISCESAAKSLVDRKSSE